MLLLHQAGAVKVGEVVRYTLTYTPANDRILPTPSHLHIKVKNTSAIPLRAAWVHGPYCLHVSAYPETFNPYQKTEEPSRDGEPQYEPMLKASGNWQAKLLVPEDIRETGADLGKKRASMQEGMAGGDDGKGSVTWIIEIASQILFSNSASVHFELLAGRDERSLDLGFAAVAGHGHGGPGHVQPRTTEKDRKRAREKGHVQTAGVYSKAVQLLVEDTEVLWDKPPLPTNEELHSRQSHEGGSKRQSEDTGGQGDTSDSKKKKQQQKKKKIHLVVVTHGLHSNLGADMLFMKESIDATVAQARMDAKKRKSDYSAGPKKSSVSESAKAVDAEEDKQDADSKEEEPSTAPLTGGQEDIDSNEADSKDDDDDSDDDEQTVVRGFPGNAVRTENGIQYLGKRLAKYILRFTYPDQPYLPIKKPFSKTLSDTFKSEDAKARRDGMPSHAGSSVHHESDRARDELAYTFTSISFIGHSLGGLIQTYAIAYIHKHNPSFFTHTKPVNFICMASPMLGLSNENPMYVKFALDFGLVGRTGQDLGLTWRAPSALARGGWNAMIGGLGAGQKTAEQQAEDPSSKPLLRILPTGPAHQVLRMFRNRTLYSNVVNDGIVPLRTSCLLFLDWRGLGKVDKARRENGLIGTVAEWGWNEIMGQNSGAVPERTNAERPAARSASMPEQAITERDDEDEDEDDEHIKRGEGEAVPLPDADETGLDARRLTTRSSFDETMASRTTSRSESTPPKKQPQQQDAGMWDNFMSFFRPKTPTPEQSSLTQRSKKTSKAFRRGQTVYADDSDEGRGREGTTTDNPTIRPHMHHTHTGQAGSKRPQATRGDSLTMSQAGELLAPPKTSIFESAGDILHPPLPGREWISDPSSRSRTIFHDRVYHPDDIPPPPAKRQASRFGLSFAPEASMKSSQSSNQSQQSQDSTESGGMKVEEKIARAYHRDLSWRKVLVRLEPDAHNNMIVRRMFANAYGWPVIKHLCDTHFADTHAARTRDEYEAARERALALHEPKSETEEEVAEQTAAKVVERTQSETREAGDELPDLAISRDGAAGSWSSKTASQLSRHSTETLWDDKWFEGDDDDGSDIDERSFVQRMMNPMPIKKPEPVYQAESEEKVNGGPTTPTKPYTDGHRGLSPTTERTSSSAKCAATRQSMSDAATPGMPVVAERISQEPEVVGSTAELGLRKNVEELVSSPKTAAIKGQSGSSVEEDVPKMGPPQV